MPETLSAVQLCNLALSRIGVLQQINSITDASTASEIACAAAYDFTRQQLLNEFPWGWASKYALLTQISAVGVPANAEYAYAYQYPTDCLKLRRLIRTPSATTIVAGSTLDDGWDREDTQAYPVIYEVGFLSGAQCIYANESNLTAKYTFDQGDTTPYLTSFADIFVWRLAVELAYPLANSEERRQTAQKNYEMARLKGAANALNEQQNSQPFQPWNTETIRGRFVE